MVVVGVGDDDGGGMVNADFAQAFVDRCVVRTDAADGTWFADGREKNPSVRIVVSPSKKAIDETPRNIARSSPGWISASSAPTGGTYVVVIWHGRPTAQCDLQCSRGCGRGDRCRRGCHGPDHLR